MLDGRLSEALLEVSKMRAYKHAGGEQQSVGDGEAIELDHFSQHFRPLIVINNHNPTPASCFSKKPCLLGGSARGTPQADK